MNLPLTFFSFLPFLHFGLAAVGGVDVGTIAGRDSVSHSLTALSAAVAWVAVAE